MDGPFSHLHIINNFSIYCLINQEKLPISEICLEPCEIDIKSEIIELSDDEDTKTTLNYPVGIRIGIASNRVCCVEFFIEFRIIIKLLLLKIIIVTKLCIF